MPVLQLPDFDQTLTISAGHLNASELSECHGVACGLLCRQPNSQADAFIDQLDVLQLVKEPDSPLASQLTDLYNATISQLGDDQLRVKLWLPADEELLEDRTEALAYWCTGFLAGIGSGPELTKDLLSEDVSDALGDLEQIARAEMTSDGESEEEEGALVEIVEYIRMVVLMIKEELSLPTPADKLH
jgi:uncharacterized protein YgfB (UPF0149 family)